MAEKDVKIDIDIGVITTGVDKAISKFDNLKKAMVKSAAPVTPEEKAAYAKKLKEIREKKKAEEEPVAEEEVTKKKKRVTKKKKAKKPTEKVEEEEEVKPKTTKKRKKKVRKPEEEVAEEEVKPKKKRKVTKKKAEEPEEVKPKPKKKRKAKKPKPVKVEEKEEITPQKFFERFWSNLTETEKKELGVKHSVEKTTKAREKQIKVQEKATDTLQASSKETEKVVDEGKEDVVSTEKGTKSKAKSTNVEKQKRAELKKQQAVLQQASMAELLMGKYQGSRAEVVKRLTAKSGQLGKANWSLVSVQMSLLGVFFSTLMMSMYLSRVYTALIGPLSDLGTAIKNTAFAYGLAEQMGVDVEGTFGKLDEQVEKTTEGWMRVKFVSAFASLALLDIASAVFSNNEVWEKFKEIMKKWKDVAPDVKEAAKGLFNTMLDIILQLIPELPGILDFFTKLLKFIKPFLPFMAKAMLFAMTFMAVLAPIAAALGGVAFVVKMVAVIIGVSASAAAGWIAIAAVAVIAIGYLFHKLGILKDVIKLVVDWVKSFKSGFVFLLPVVHDITFAITHFSDILHILKTALQTVWDWLGNVRSAISRITSPLSGLIDKLEWINNLFGFLGVGFGPLPGVIKVATSGAGSSTNIPIQQSNEITNYIYTPADKDEITESILDTLFNVGRVLGL